MSFRKKLLLGQLSGQENGDAKAQVRKPPSPKKAGQEKKPVGWASKQKIAAVSSQLRLVRPTPPLNLTNSGIRDNGL